MAPALTAGGKRDCAQQVLWFPCPAFFLSFPKQLCLQLAVKERDGWGVDKASADPVREIPLFLDCGSSLTCFRAKLAVPILSIYPCLGAELGRRVTSSSRNTYCSQPKNRWASREDFASKSSPRMGCSHFTLQSGIAWQESMVFSDEERALETLSLPQI